MAAGERERPLNLLSKNGRAFGWKTAGFTLVERSW